MFIGDLLPWSDRTMRTGSRSALSDQRGASRHELHTIAGAGCRFNTPVPRGSKRAWHIYIARRGDEVAIVRQNRAHSPREGRGIQTVSSGRTNNCSGGVRYGRLESSRIRPASSAKVNAVRCPVPLHRRRQWFPTFDFDGTTVETGFAVLMTCAAPCRRWMCGAGLHTLVSRREVRS